MDLKTPLYDAHVKAGGRIVPFAGYLLPVQQYGRKRAFLMSHTWVRSR